jgi:hypothetical protein
MRLCKKNYMEAGDLYGQRPNYHKFYCSALCMKCNEKLHGQISELLVGQTNVREPRKI